MKPNLNNPAPGTKPFLLRSLYDDKRDLDRLPQAISESIRSICNGKKPDPQVAELSRHMTVLNDGCSEPEFGFVLPREAVFGVETRALDPSALSTGGALVAALVGSPQFLPRPLSVARLAGAGVLLNLSSNFSIPREAVELQSASFWHQQDTVTSTQGSLGQIGCSPHRAALTTIIDKQLIAQYPQTQDFVFEAIRHSAMALEDKGFFSGGISGIGGVEPVGILTNPNVLTETFGATATLAKAVDFQTQILSNNGRVQQMCYVGSPNVRAKWQTLQEFSGSSFPLWKAGQLGGEQIAGIPAYVTNSVTANNIVCGDFSSALLLYYGQGSPIQFTYDIYTLKKTGQVEVYAEFFFDAVVTQPGLWVRNTDSAVQ